MGDGIFFCHSPQKKRKKERKIDNPENTVVFRVTATPHQNELNVVCAIGKCAVHPLYIFGVFFFITRPQLKQIEIRLLVLYFVV